MTDFARASALAEGDIPIIDLAPLLRGESPEGIAAQIHRAAVEVGFFYIAGHGIEDALMARAFAVARDFFEGPEPIKASVSVNTQQRGWMATGMSHLEGAATHDLKEVFFWGREIAADDPDLLAGKPLIAPNQWPADFPRLRDELTPYYNAVNAVGAKLLEAIAVSLDIPPAFFDPHYAKPLARGQLVYYPPSTAGDEAEERFGVAPHTDFGVLTLLLQDQSGGLQVRLKSGVWVEAPPIPGTLVCNIGDLLQRWSNDRFVSTVHRVVNRTRKARISIPVFYDPAPDAIVDPADLGVLRADCLHEPIAAGDHIMGRNKKNFAQYQKKT